MVGDEQDEPPGRPEQARRSGSPRPRQIVHFKGKLVLLGDIGVGKTSTMVRCQEDRFARDQKSTIGISYSQLAIAVDGSVVAFEIWDSAGEERFRSVNSLYYHGAGAGVVVFDVTRRSSFESAKSHWIPHLREQGAEDAIVALVGNKSDLAALRQVSRAEASAFAECEGAMYFEISAKTGRGVHELFHGIAARVPQLFAGAGPRAAGAEGFRIVKVDGLGGAGRAGLGLGLDLAPSEGSGCCF